MTHYDPVLYSRILTALTLGFHILFATLGVGIPILIGLAEWMGIRRKDYHYIVLARRWARGFTITVAVGVVTGTAIGLQLSLLWPSFMQLAGQVIALPLFMEVFAFFFEAIFLGIYLYTWDRFKNQTTHFLLIIPVIIGSTMSAFFITTVNAFMNTPQGFRLEGGIMTDVWPIAAMFNPATPTEAAHVIISAYATSAFVLAGIAAFRMWKGNHHMYYKKALKLTMVAAFIFSLFTVLIGDFSGKFLAEYQPEKLAAAEWHFDTLNNAPLVVGGILTHEDQIKYALKIPFALSILAHGYPTASVKGLNEFPKSDLPPLYIHYFFDAMVFIGTFMFVVALWYMIAYKRKKWNPYHRGLLLSIIIASPLSMLAIEYGWMFAEIGRQPWILRGFMRTAEGATTSLHVDLMLILFIVLYTVLGITVMSVLRKMFKHNPPEQELESFLKGGQER